MSQDPKTYSVTEAAEILGVTDRTIRKWIENKTLPGAWRLDPTNDRSPYRIPQTSVDNILEQRKTGN